MRDMDTNNTEEQSIPACCGNCLFFCEHEKEGFVHCLVNERETPKPDEAPCGQWAHKDAHFGHIRLKIELTPQGMSVSMSSGREEQKGLLESILGKLGWFFLLLQMIALVVNLMVGGGQSRFVYFFMVLAVFCLGTRHLLRRRRWHNDQRTRESRRGYEPTEEVV